MSVERHAQSIVVVFRNVEHAGAEVFGSLSSFVGDQLQHHAGSRVRDRLE